MQFDRAKLKTVILYTCAKCDPGQLGAVKLHKVLYFADMLHYAWKGTSITGATYRKQIHGPTCEQLLSVLREMSAEKSIKIQEADYFGFKKKQYIPLGDPEIKRLKDSELAILNEVTEFVCLNNTAKTISEFSHMLPWEMAKFGAVIPYHTAFLLLPSEVSPEALDWAEAEAKNIATARAKSDGVAYTDGTVLRRRLREAHGI